MSYVISIKSAAFDCVRPGMYLQGLFRACRDFSQGETTVGLMRAPGRDKGLGHLEWGGLSALRGFRTRL
jgi:hypothetical protein